MKTVVLRLLYYLKNEIKNTVSLVAINTVLLCLLGISISIGVISNVYKASIESNLELLVSTHNKISDAAWTNTIEGYKMYEDEINKYYDFCLSLKEKYNCDYLSVSKRLMNRSPVKMFSNKDGVITVYSQLLVTDEMTQEDFNRDAKEEYYRIIDSLSSEHAFIWSRLQSVTEEEFIYKKRDVVRITEGRSFTEEELSSGANVCLIDESYAFISEDGGKKIEIGDKILFSQMNTSNGEIVMGDEYEFEVIGIYSMDAAMIINGSLFYPVFIPEKCFDNIYSDMVDFCATNNIDLTIRSGLAIDDIVFQVNSFEMMRSLIRDLQNSGIELIINTECNGYESIISIVNSISETFTYISFIMLGIIEILSVISELSDYKRMHKDTLIKKSLGENNAELVADRLLYSIVYFAASSIVPFIVIYNAIKYIDKYLSNATATINGISKMGEVSFLLIIGIAVTLLIKIVTYSFMLINDKGELNE